MSIYNCMSCLACKHPYDVYTYMSTNIYILETCNIGMYQLYQRISICNVYNRRQVWLLDKELESCTTMHTCQYCGPVEIGGCLPFPGFTCNEWHLKSNTCWWTKLCQPFSTEPNGKESLVTIPMQNWHYVRIYIYISIIYHFRDCKTYEPGIVKQSHM